MPRPKVFPGRPRRRTDIVDRRTPRISARSIAVFRMRDNRGRRVAGKARREEREEIYDAFSLARDRWPLKRITSVCSVISKRRDERFEIADVGCFQEHAAGIGTRIASLFSLQSVTILAFTRAVVNGRKISWRDSPLGRTRATRNRAITRVWYREFHACLRHPSISRLQTV